MMGFLSCIYYHKWDKILHSLVVQSIDSEAKMPGFKPYDVGCVYMPLTPHLYNEYHDRTCLIVEMIGGNLYKALRVCAVYSKLNSIIDNITWGVRLCPHCVCSIKRRLKHHPTNWGNIHMWIWTLKQKLWDWVWIYRTGYVKWPLKWSLKPVENVLSGPFAFEDPTYV